ncbi:hypothetical protein ASE26_12695 [Duganella sp. Root198D2]|nr:hypothetical protein ASE26_12695 [Duganella sp. Root198D2]
MAAGRTPRWTSGEEPKPDIIVKLAVFLACAVFCLSIPARQWLGWRAAQSYVAVPVEMRKLEKEAYSYKGRLEYRYHVEYEYEVAGRAYRSSKMFLMDDFPTGQPRACLYESLRQAHEAHAPIMAWVDPEKPANALLDREAYDDPMYFIFAGIALAVLLGTAAYYFVPCQPKPARKRLQRLNRSW